MPQRRHVARAVVSATAATTVLALATPAWADTTVDLNQSNVTAGGFDTQECDDPRFAGLPDGYDGWHFVLPNSKDGSGDFVSLSLEFTDGVQTVQVEIPDDGDPYPDAFYSTGGPNPQVKHAYLFTPAGWTLVTGTATITGTGDEFNLSHTCPGEQTPPTSPPPTSQPATTPPATTPPATSPPATSPVPSESVSPSASATPGGGGGGDLPLTGAAATTIALLGVGLIGGGAALVMLRRRRDDVTFTS